MNTFIERLKTRAASAMIDRASTRRGTRLEPAKDRRDNCNDTGVFVVTSSCTCGTGDFADTHTVSCKLGKLVIQGSIDPRSIKQGHVIPRGGIIEYSAWRKTQHPHPVFSPSAYADVAYMNGVALPSAIGIGNMASGNFCPTCLRVDCTCKASRHKPDCVCISCREFRVWQASRVVSNPSYATPTPRYAKGYKP